MITRTFLRSLRPVLQQTARSYSAAPKAHRRPGGSVVFGVSALALGAAAYGISPLNCSNSGEVDAVKKDIIELMEAEDERRSDGTSIGGTLVRLAWHASGTYSAKDRTGGSNGACMRFAPEANWGCNAGLGVARAFLEPIKAKHPTWSYADIWTLAGATAIEAMGGPAVPWRPGRSDSIEGTTVPDGRLPNADSGSPSNDVAHIRNIFYRMGFNDREIVALIGAHSVGRCHTEASGYWGPWDFSEAAFSNQYFVLMLSEKWTPKKTHNGKKWKGPAQFEDKTGALMMLPADLALLHDPEFRKYVELYAKDEQAFFNDFSAAFSKLLELGVPFPAPQKKGLLGLGIFGL